MSSPTLRRRAAAAAFLLALAPVITACGFNAQTDVPYQSAIGTQSRTGQVWILNAVVVSATDGKGTFAGTLVNQSDTENATLQSVTAAKGAVSVDVPAGGLVNLATDGAVRLRDPDITPGGHISLSFQFSNGQVTTLDVPVFPNTGDYTDVPVGSKASSTDQPSADATSSAG